MSALAIIKRYTRPVIFSFLSVSTAVLTESIFWLPLALLAIFYFSIDVFRVDKNRSMHSTIPENIDSLNIGILGHYVIDSTELYGLFIRLEGKAIFIDIREDNLTKERESYAVFLFINSAVLENNLSNFLTANHEYMSRQISFIGLHSQEREVGEVFWEPTGYTKLRNLKFTIN